MYKEVQRQLERLFALLILFHTFLSEDNIKIGL